MRTILILEVTMIKGFLYLTLCNLADSYQSYRRKCRRNQTLWRKVKGDKTSQSYICYWL